MVYIDRHGRVWEKRPWDWQRVVEIFVGLWHIIVQFVQTLLAPFLGGNAPNSRRNNWGGGGGSGGGGGGGGGGGSGGGGLRPNRNIGRIVNSVDAGSCGMGGG